MFFKAILKEHLSLLLVKFVNQKPTCSSVLRSPNSSKKVLSDWNCSGSRKFKRLNSSSTEFCRGVPVSKTLCSWEEIHTGYGTLHEINKRRHKNNSSQCGSLEQHDTETEVELQDKCTNIFNNCLYIFLLIYNSQVSLHHSLCSALK